MATQQAERLIERFDLKRTGGVVEAVAAAIGMALAIIGLAGAASRVMDAITVIVLGAAFLFERWTMTARAHEGVAPMGHGESLTSEAVAGWTGVVLGILALLRLAPTVLTPIAVIVFGAGLALSAGVATRSARVLVGLGVTALGILALIRIDPRTLTLIGMLAVGAVLLMTGPAVGSRLHHAVRQPAA
jgi:hypothetical protein